MYDPLTLDFPGHLTADGRIVEARPEAGFVHFPADDVGGNPPTLSFAMAAPARFVPTKGLEVRAHLVADKPVVMGNAIGADNVRVDLLVEGKLVAQRGASVPSLLKPGDAADFGVTLEAPAVTIEKGANVTLLIRLGATGAPAESIRLLVGGASPSTASFVAAALPTLADLELEQPRQAAVFLLAKTTFTPPEPGAVLTTFSVGHDAVAAISPLATGRVTYVVLRGDEGVAEARASHEFPDAERRNGAAHVFRVGDLRVRVHPGVGVAARVEGGAALDVVCESGCPSGGFRATLPASTSAGPAFDPNDTTSLLIPPPPRTQGVPVSEDAPPEEKKAPGASFALLLPALAALALARRR